MAEELNWGDGNYERTARTLEPTAEVVLDTAEVTPGERVLDVACGTGNAALAAAQRGTRTVGVDPAEALRGESTSPSGAGTGHGYRSGRGCARPSDSSRRLRST
jgi:2-polyprenyl-3-methyl-5-hydroxy-6-metoxy-1,4-benzoquinol methylase